MQTLSRDLTDAPRGAAGPRAIASTTRGRRHGPVTRIFSPGDLGQVLKPFVFLDHFDFMPQGRPLFPMHPHSGIATTTILLGGDMRYEDTTGAAGTLEAGSVEWLRAGNGVWHDASPLGSARFRGYQLWLALPPELESRPPASQYLASGLVPQAGPARVILGSHNQAASPVEAPKGVNTLHVRLGRGQRWTYEPPAGHAVVWVHVGEGSVRVAGATLRDELAVFEESEQAIEFTAESDAELLLGSAVRHAHDLVLGHYSVHTSTAALRSGENGIAAIGERLRLGGRVR